MREFATADCETNPFEFGAVISPFIWGFYNKDGFQYFFSTEDFIEFLKGYEGIVYFHNGGKFDFHFLFEGLIPETQFMMINGRVAKMKIGCAELRDSYLLLPVPLSAYKKDEIDYEKFRPENRMAHMAEIHTYLKADCKYLYDILAVQFDEFGQKLTLASSAFDYWHKKFNKFKNKPKTNAAFFKEFKPFYFGGRVQCFEKGIIERPFKVFDINSAYPYAMNFEHPYGNEIQITDKLPENLDGTFVEFRGISTNGCLPFRTPEKTLIFPADNEIRIYKVTGWELKLALETNSVKIDKIIYSYEFLNKICFAEYVEHFFKMKSDAKDVSPEKYLLSKLYMNSLYGKFGQSGLDHRDYELIEQCYIKSYMRQEYEFEAEIGDLALVSKPIEPEKMRFYNVATAASITGFVRAYLYKHILAATDPIYCDTDSIACGNFDGIVGDKIGEWGFEGNFIRGAIGGKKLYSFEREVKKKCEKFKISSKGAKLTAKEIFSIAMGEEISYKSIAPTFKVGKEPEYLVRKIRMT